MSFGMNNSPITSPSGKMGNIRPKGHSFGQLQQFTPEQQQLFQQLFSHVGPQSYLSRLAGGDQSMFEEMEAPALRQFNELQGGIASRFSGMGMGARRSSGFQNTVNAAASNFAQDLQARRQDLQRQAIMDLMGLSHTLLGERPYEQFFAQKQQKPNYWAQAAGKLAGAIPGAAVGFLSGGPVGAAVGATSAFSSAPTSSSFVGNKTSGPYGLPTFLGR